MKIVPRPRPTAPIMKAKPIVLPASCGSGRRNPEVRPDDSNMMLFGPGVKNITVANTTKAMNSDCDMLHSGGLGQDLLPHRLRPLRQQHDRNAADHGEHPGQAQRSKSFADQHGPGNLRAAHERAWCGGEW